MNDKRLKIVIIGDNDRIVAKQKKVLSVLPNISIKSVSGIHNHDNYNHLLYDKNTDNILNHLLCDNDIVIFNLSSSGVAELKFLEEIEIKNADVVAVGEDGNLELLKNAISAGVTEFITYDEFETELIHVIDKIKHQSAIKQKVTKKTVFNAIINAKGGGGASFIASNLAYILSEKTDSKAILIDMDFQFGAIGLNFDIDSKYTITDALNEIDEVDAVSILGYVSKYNKLGLLLPSVKEVILPGEIPTSSLDKLLNFVTENYDQVIVDLPKIIDPLNSLIMEKADKVMIIVQQNLTSFRDGRRLIQILNKDLDIPLNNISVLINRYDKNNSLKKGDMANILKHEHIYTVTNDFERVASATNLGIPLFESAPGSKIAQDLLRLARYLGKTEFKKKKGLLKRFMNVVP